ncbi:hypothetical protein [Streptomyces sp. NPDC020742]|uniref:hypothetical protein n=1 Tax=Streptomyces sp. NPDC020742 TaxID=3154897 RepID=UPI0033D37373
MTAPTDAPGGTVRAAFATGYLATRIAASGPESDEPYVWVRSPGPRRPRPFSPVTPAIREAVAGLSGGPVVLNLGLPVGAGRSYPAGAARSAGHVLAGGPDNAGWHGLSQLIHGVGQLLHRVHTSLPKAWAAREPAGAARLSLWLDGEKGPGAGPTLHTAARARLGPERWERARTWCEEAAADRADTVFLCGGVSMGSLIPAAVGGASGRGTLLAGEEFAAGPPEYDIGWLLGELAEFRLRHLTAHPEASSHCAHAARQFLAGYGTGSFDTARAGRMAALRVLTHAHDFAAYVGWADDLRHHLDLAADLIDTEGAPALCADGLPMTPRTT